MTQLWSPSTLPSRTAPDDGTFYGHRRGQLTAKATQAASPPSPDIARMQERFDFEEALKADNDARVRAHGPEAAL